MYDHKQPTEYSEDDCQAAVGKRATLALTGQIVSYQTSDAGPFVKFQPDERWGMGDFRFGIDLDALDIK